MSKKEDEVDVLGWKEQMEELVERMRHLEEENATLRQSIQTTSDGRGMVLPAGMMPETVRYRQNILTPIAPSQPGFKTRYASTQSLPRRLQEGWQIVEGAKSVGDSIPIETPADNSMLVMRKRAQEQRDSAYERELAAAHGVRRPHPSAPAEVFTEYERVRGSGS